MNRQVNNQINVGIFMAVYACTSNPPIIHLLLVIILTLGSEIFFSKVGAVISDRWGAYYVIIIGTISQVIGQIIMIFNNTSQNTLWYVIAYVFHGGADSCFQTQALALTLYYFPGLSAVANACFRLVSYREFNQQSLSMT